MVDRTSSLARRAGVCFLNGTGKPVKYIRGLEPLTNLGQEREISIRAHVHAVLKEQQRQWHEKLGRTPQDCAFLQEWWRR